jgi:hypothetical protein
LHALFSSLFIIIIIIIIIILHVPQVSVCPGNYSGLSQG